MKQRKDAGKCGDKKEKATQEITGERRKIKKISTMGKKIQTKQDIPE